MKTLKCTFCDKPYIIYTENREAQGIGYEYEEERGHDMNCFLDKCDPSDKVRLITNFMKPFVMPKVPYTQTDEEEMEGRIMRWEKIEWGWRN